MKTKAQAVAEKSMWDKPVQPQEDITLYSIAQVKAFDYMQEYNPYTGRTEDKQGANLLRQGYMAGFLAGFAHRLTGGNDD